MANRKATHTQPTETTNAKATMNNVHVAPFWDDEPALWFAQLEVQFAVNGVTSDIVNYAFVLSKLKSEYAKEISHVLKNLPVKNELIRRLRSLQHERIQQLLEKEEIGDRTPSNFLRNMRAFAGGTVRDDFLPTIWMSRLPPTLRRIVTAMNPSQPLYEMATVADQVLDTLSQVASISGNAETLALRNEMMKLGNRVARPRSRSRQRRRSMSPATRDYCWYHQTFGARSTKSHAPCSY